MCGLGSSDLSCLHRSSITLFGRRQENCPGTISKRPQKFQASVACTVSNVHPGPWGRWLVNYAFAGWRDCPFNVRTDNLQLGNSGIMKRAGFSILYCDSCLLQQVACTAMMIFSIYCGGRRQPRSPYLADSQRYRGRSSAVLLMALRAEQWVKGLCITEPSSESFKSPRSSVRLKYMHEVIHEAGQIACLTIK